MICATPFHARTAERNRANRWAMRNRFTVASDFGDAAAEAMAARMRVVVSDISWRWRMQLEGARVRDLAQRLFTRDPGTLQPGTSAKALWLSDGGGVRGAGLIARIDMQAFQLVSACEDARWIADAAALFGVEARDVTEDAGGLALIGPYAARLIATLGFDPALEPLAFRTFTWRGLDITLSRFGEHNGYELWCKADDALLLWDRVEKAGMPFALTAAGAEAMDILDIESGVPRPVRDYDGASSPNSAEPLAAELRLSSLIDAEHISFNGRPALLAARPGRKLVGIVFEGDVPSAFAAILAGETQIGRTLSAVYSHALRRAIALAQVDEDKAHAGAAVHVVPPAARNPCPPLAARIVDLPFLAPPDPIET
ncbi:MAG: aminomethyltransferase family protein [Proteobacteria bacterium]|nr:aminomethyltransferase family protein [Pseudomonadota bacterium]